MVHIVWYGVTRGEIKLDINTRIIDMDTLIGEQVVKNVDDSYTILLNARLSSEKQMECYRHALNHINNNDFEKEIADKIEFDSHFI